MVKIEGILLSFGLLYVVSAYDNNFIDVQSNRVTTCRCSPYQFESNVGQIGGIVQDGKPEEVVVSMIIDHKAWEIICLVVSVCPFVSDCSHA